MPRMEKYALLTAMVLASVPARAEQGDGATVGPFTLRPHGEARLLFQARPDADFAGTYGDRAGQGLVQTRLGLEAAMQDLSLFLELHDGREVFVPESQRTQVFPLDLHQAYLQLKVGETAKSTFRLGRQSLAFGSKRMMTPKAWSNNQPAYDGVSYRLSLEPWAAQAFAARRVIKDGSALDFGEDSYPDGEYLWGVLGNRRITPWLTAEAYLLGLHYTQETEAVDEGYRLTPGVRLYGATLGGQLKYDVEGAYQFGTSGDRSVSAHALHGDVAYTFAAPLRPTVHLVGNLASGDGDPTDGVDHTFNPLFGIGHGYYGLMDYFRWQNMRELAFGVSVTPWSTLSLSTDYHLFWLDDPNGAWVNAAGKPLQKPVHPGEGELAAQEVDLAVRWRPVDHLQLEAAAAYVPAPHRAAVPDGAQDAAKDSWRTYLQAVVSF